jgi:hypothetical protein
VPRLEGFAACHIPFEQGLRRTGGSSAEGLGSCGFENLLDRLCFEGHDGFEK